MKARFHTVFAAAFLAASSALASDYCVEGVAIGGYERFVSQKKGEQVKGPLVRHLPMYSATVKLEGSSLSFVDAGGQTYQVVRLNSGDDFSGWIAIYELENGWIYVEGAQYNHAVQLVRDAQRRWQVAQIIRLRESEGIVERLARLIIGTDGEQMKRDNLTAIQRVPRYAVYSEALHKLIYPVVAKELRSGELVRFGDGRARTYVGDIPRLKTAFFQSDDGQLYFYSDAQLRPVSNGELEPYFTDGKRLQTGHVHDVPALRRSFYSFRFGVYELIRQPNGYELRKINLPRDVGDLLFARFIPAPDDQDIMLLTRGDIFLLSSMESIFSRPVPKKQINITGSDLLPALIPELEGILFSTGGGYIPEDKTEYFHLVKRCFDKSSK